ncbi:uncharacterized protein [Diabrotica undecimpunctata]|uniref:uncharacterized protein n=1 Tax=Diabrotica undecimpunctata TaxID=50387 RepID=UPI003B6374D0
MVKVTRRHGAAIVKPEIVVSYNKSKAFIDLSDQINAYSPYLRRTLKWYRRLILECILGTTMVNPFVMYNANRKLSVTDFRHTVAEELFYPTEEAPLAPDPPPIREHRLQAFEGVYQKVKTRCTGCYECLKRERDRKYAAAQTKKGITKRLSCDKFFCLSCFNEKHP